MLLCFDPHLYTAYLLLRQWLYLDNALRITEGVRRGTDTSQHQYHQRRNLGAGAVG